MTVHCMFQSLKVTVLLLFVHSLLDPCLLHLHPTHRADLPTHLPLPQFIKGMLWGQSLCWFPWQPMNQPDVNSPYNWQALLMWEEKTDAMSCLLATAAWWGVAPGPCFRHVSFPHPLNHWYLCCWFWAITWVCLNTKKAQVIQACRMQPNSHEAKQFTSINSFNSFNSYKHQQDKHYYYLHFKNEEIELVNVKSISRVRLSTRSWGISNPVLCMQYWLRQ